MHANSGYSEGEFNAFWYQVRMTNLEAIVEDVEGSGFPCVWSCNTQSGSLISADFLRSDIQQSAPGGIPPTCDIDVDVEDDGFNICSAADPPAFISISCSGPLNGWRLGIQVVHDSIGSPDERLVWSPFWRHTNTLCPHHPGGWSFQGFGGGFVPSSVCEVGTVSVT
jgi:hypothetical protein